MADLDVTFTEAQLAGYAEASGDRNPIHLDSGFARSVGLPGVIVHGMLQMGFAARVAAEAAGGASHLRTLRCRFAGMVRPGETVRFEAHSEAGRIAISATATDGTAVLTKATAELFDKE